MTEGAEFYGSRGIEQIGKLGLARLSHTPRPGTFTANAVPEAGFLLDHEHIQADQGPAPHRASIWQCLLRR
jgi:hypothetical protein